MRQKINKKRTLLKGQAINFLIKKQLEGKIEGVASDIIANLIDELKISRLSKRKDVTGKILYIETLEKTKVEHLKKNKHLLIERAISTLGYAELDAYISRINPQHSRIAFYMAKNKLSYLIAIYKHFEKLELDTHFDVYMKNVWGNNFVSALRNIERDPMNTDKN